MLPIHAALAQQRANGSACRAYVTSRKRRRLPARIFFSAAAFACSATPAAHAAVYFHACRLPDGYSPLLLCLSRAQIARRVRSAAPFTCADATNISMAREERGAMRFTPSFFLIRLEALFMIWRREDIFPSRCEPAVLAAGAGSAEFRGIMPAYSRLFA